MAEVWGAATELGPDRAGNARLIFDPRKHGLELSRDGNPGESRGVAPEGGRAPIWRAAAPGLRGLAAHRSFAANQHGSPAKPGDDEEKG
jgi:hypothetical protein